ncbi:MAG: type II toxin-antitoxin system VapC family toxin [Verrucomicrobiota bacterium]|nr:type II toxin-antitoxin system VapC family toxin [Verrucomicrobiota bacterium]
MKAKVYLETSVISYLTARASRDVVASACQKMTQDWWEKRRVKFQLYISELVINEIERGNATAAKRRMDCVVDMTRLEITAEIQDLAQQFVRKNSLPAKASADALHIAIATVHGMDYLLTWNCTHIANAEIMPVIASICAVAGFKSPLICTPQELMGE